ncbi:Major Facilitator Superfamily protein [Sinosporangium album]|uniref:Major Facilitator Superfamily protein n=1 Tax=Sinosporangium album TaxID=504805 RepID=A0A1G7V5Q3_9ACTN|nr:MFS transporter [Sinosporangium album]SDG55215.1 Major Facilitator Superfamily protein [Sinosporangium album]
MTAPKTLDAPYRPVRIFGPEYRTATLGIVLVVTLIAFEGMAVGVVMPAVSADLDAIDLYGWSFSAFLMSCLFANVVAGLWSDRKGHALPFLLGVFLFIVGMLLAGVAQSKEMFILARAVQGLGGGAVIVAAYVMIARVYVPEARPKVFAALSGAWVVPALVGPSVSALIADLLGWRWVFFGIVPLVIPALIMLLPALRVGPAAGAVGAADAADAAGATGGADQTAAGDRTASGPPAGLRSRAWARTVAATTAAGGAGLLLYGLDTMDNTPALGAVEIIVGLALLAFGLPLLLPRRALRFARGLPTTVMMRGLLSAAFFGVNAFIPLLLTKVHGFSLTQAGFALTIGAIGWSFGSYLQSKRTFDRVRLVRFGACAVAAGVALALPAALPGMSGWMVVPAWLVAGLGMGIAVSSVNVTTLKQSPEGEQGVNSAALQVTDTLGSSLSIGVGGAVINMAGHGAGQIATGFALIAGLMTALGVFGILVSGRMRESSFAT